MQNLYGSVAPFLRALHVLSWSSVQAVTLCPCVQRKSQAPYSSPLREVVTTFEVPCQVVLFCSSGTGIYGSLDAGMTGNVTILMSKSVLDFFTAMIFACSLGIITSVIAVPQFLIFLCLFLLAKLIYPLTTPVMINDFKACGGFVLLATGLRIAKIKEFPIADMIPAMILVMPISAFWVNCVAPML